MTQFCVTARLGRCTGGPRFATVRSGRGRRSHRPGVPSNSALTPGDAHLDNMGTLVSPHTPMSDRSAAEPTETSSVLTYRADAPASAPHDDRIAVEAPLEIRFGGTSTTVLMRTPGCDEELVRGFVAKLQGQGNAEAERLRDAMRKAVAVLQAAVDSSTR